MVLHVQFELHSNRDILTYFTAKNRSSFICIHGLKNHKEGSDLVHTLILWVSWSLLIFVMAIFGPLVDQYNLKGGVSRAHSQRKVFRTFYSTCFEISVWNLVYTSIRWCHMSSSSFIPIWTLWPTLQPKISQSHLSAFMALKVIYRPQIWYTHSKWVPWSLLIFVMLGQFLALWWKGGVNGAHSQ